jgi:hypothetical protein
MICSKFPLKRRFPSQVLVTTGLRDGCLVGVLVIGFSVGGRVGLVVGSGVGFGVGAGGSPIATDTSSTIKLVPGCPPTIIRYTLVDQAPAGT